MIPAADTRLLPENHAGMSKNAWLYSGSIVGLRAPVDVRTLAMPAARRAYRIPKQYNDKDHIPDSYWLEFLNSDVDVIRSPASGDTFERYYWASSQSGGTTDAPLYNTKARIIAGQAPFTLGIPAPIVAPGVTPATGGATESRAYVYTWVSAYGEESGPSPATLATGSISGSWALTLTAPGAGVIASRNLTKVRIYRTITSSAGTTTYFFVTELTIATLSYADTALTTAVSGNDLLASLYWTPPPADLEGMVSLPNGILAGWRANELWFSEPYRPHAWPSIYTQTVEFPIVGLGVIGQSVIVLTTSAPYVATGVSPASMSLAKIAAIEPCTSRGSIVSTPTGVLFASPNGLALATPASVAIISRGLISKDDWADPVNFLAVPTLRAGMVNGAYYCWGSLRAGCFDGGGFDPGRFLQDDFTGSYLGAMIDVSNGRIAWQKITSTSPTYACFTDTLTGEVFLIRDGKVMWLDIAVSRPHQTYVWRSKKFEAPNQRNFGAMRCYFDKLADTPGLNPVANAAPVQTLAADQYGLVRVYADGILRFTRELRTSGELMRLPSGFKAAYWEVEFEARIMINSFEIATTAKELISV